MRPKNNREREVVRLSAGLPWLTESQFEWLRTKGIPWHIYENGEGRGWCERCGNPIEGIKAGAKYATCPHCGIRLPINRYKERERRKFANRDVQFFLIVTVCHGYQVIRYFVAEWKGKRGEQSRFTLREVMQKWCQPGKPTITLAVPVVMLPGYSKVPYSHNGVLTIKSSDSYWYQEWMYVKVYPRLRLLPVYKKTVKNARFFDHICAEDILAIIYSNPYFESLYKAGNMEELKSVAKYANRFSKYWPSIRIALRHGFKPKDWYNYLDYLAMLAFLHKDMRSPHYVAPTDWDAMHTLICRQARNKREEMERRREERERIRRAEAEARNEAERKEARKSFPERIAKFKDLNIVGCGLVIRPLMSIAEFAEEGDAMGHCVFSRAYYSHPLSLILSARAANTGKRVETIEVNLGDMTVAQSRGHNNLFTDKHEEILRLLADAMPTIDAMAHPGHSHIRVTPSRS